MHRNSATKKAFKIKAVFLVHNSTKPHEVRAGGRAQCARRANSDRASRVTPRRARAISATVMSGFASSVVATSRSSSVSFDGRPPVRPNASRRLALLRCVRGSGRARIPPVRRTCGRQAVLAASSYRAPPSGSESRCFSAEAFRASRSTAS